MVKLRITYIVFFLFVYGSVQAQQLPIFSQYYNKLELINPAYSGTNEILELKLSHRDQWLGFDGAPTRNYIGVNWFFKKRLPNNAKMYSLRISHPEAYDSITVEDVGYFKKIKHGIGVNAYNQEDGPYSKVDACFNYSIHFPVGPKSYLSIGGSGGYEYEQLNMNELRVLNNDKDTYFQSLLGQNNKASTAFVNVGITFYNEFLWIGVSTRKLVVYPIEQIKEITDKFEYATYHAYAGYNISVGSRNKIIPSVSASYSEKGLYNVDFSARFLYHNMASIGALYRMNKAVSSSFGFAFNRWLELIYSYDITISNLGNYNNGSHELTLKFNFLSAKRTPIYIY